jgi:hypothetical protein
MYLDLTSGLTRKNVHKIKRSSNHTSSSKKRKSTLKHSKLDLNETGPEMDKSSARKFEEADSLEDIGPILVDWKLDISYSDSESSSDEKDTPSSTQGDKCESDIRNISNENNQILIEPTEESNLNNNTNLGILTMVFYFWYTNIEFKY